MKNQIEIVKEIAESMIGIGGISLRLALIAANSKIKPLKMDDMATMTWTRSAKCN